MQPIAHVEYKPRIMIAAKTGSGSRTMSINGDVWLVFIPTNFDITKYFSLINKQICVQYAHNIEGMKRDIIYYTGLLKKGVVLMPDNPGSFDALQSIFAELDLIVYHGENRNEDIMIDINSKPIKPLTKAIRVGGWGIRYGGWGKSEED